MSSPLSTPMGRARSMSSPTRPSFGIGPKWISSNSSPDEESEATPLRRPGDHLAAFDTGFVPLSDTPKAENEKCEKCYEELDEPEPPRSPRIKLKDGRELRPLLKYRNRKRSATHHAPDSAKWHDLPSPTSSSSPGLSSGTGTSSDNETELETESEHGPEEEHPHVHFSEELENVCVFDECAPAHDSDPTHSPLEPPKTRASPCSSPRVRTKPLRLPGTVIASPTAKSALNFTGASPLYDSPQSMSPPGSGRRMQLKLASDSVLPSPGDAPSHGMMIAHNVQLSANGDTLTGVVRVRNVAFEKRVSIVYTADDWTTRNETGSRWTDQAQGLPPRPDGWDDFEFNVPLADLGIHSSAGTAVRCKILRFAICYRASGQGEWWDSHDGANWTARFRATHEL